MFLPNISKSKIRIENIRSTIFTFCVSLHAGCSRNFDTTQAEALIKHGSDVSHVRLLRTIKNALQETTRSKSSITGISGISITLSQTHFCGPHFTSRDTNSKHILLSVSSLLTTHATYICPLQDFPDWSIVVTSWLRKNL